MTSSASSGPGAATRSTRPGFFRWTICGLLFLSVAINYIDRNIIGILKMPLSSSLHWSDTDYATIAAAFQVAYAFGYLFGGRMMDWLGVKRGFPIIMTVWSVAAAAHGLCVYIPAAKTFTLTFPWLFSAAGTVTLVIPMTVLGFVSARAALGLAEGGNFPGAIKTVAEWFPVKERALATGIFNAGTNVGAILCPLMVVRMLEWWGWPSTFYFTGALGAIWVVLWWVLYDTPEKHRWLSARERAYIESDPAPVVETRVTVPWRSLLTTRPVWAYLFASMLAGPVWGIYMFFLPDFLSRRYHLGLMAVGDWTAMFYLIASFGGIAGGWLAARLLGRGWTLNAARKISLLLCALAVVPVFSAPHVPEVWLTVIIVGIAGSGHQGWSANLFSFVSDTMPKQAISSVVGLGGFINYLTGAVVSEVIGYILETTHSYASIFAAASVMYILALSILHLLVPRIGRKV